MSGGMADDDDFHDCSDSEPFTFTQDSGSNQVDIASGNTVSSSRENPNKRPNVNIVFSAHILDAHLILMCALMRIFLLLLFLDVS